MRKIKNPWTDKEGYDCYGCCHDNPIGLHMDFYEDGDDIVCFWNPQQHFQGWVDTLHGGIQSTLIDEIASWVVFRKMSTTGVTSNLEVKFKKPVMTTENQITLRAHLVELRRNIATIEVSLYNSRNELATIGKAVYFTVSQEKAREMGFTECELEGDELRF